MKKTKVLEILPSLSISNGIAAYIMNYYKKIDKDKYEFTFLIVRDRDDKSRYEELNKTGGKIVELFLEKNIIKYYKKVDNFMKENKFDIIHCNLPMLGFIFLKCAKKHGIKNRIMHAHETIIDKTSAKSIRNKVLIKLGMHYTTSYFACSDLAGKTNFGSKKYSIINNAIDYKTYKYDEKTRTEERKKLGLKNQIVIGTVGRYTNVKNQMFIIEMMRELVKINDNIVAVIIGGGQLEKDLINKVKEYNLEHKVYILGSRKDVNKLYNIMDVFILPSIREGLPVVGIEAQANGLKCVFSNTITKEVDISNNCYFLPIGNENISKWCDFFNTTDYKRNKNSISKDYDINMSVKKIERVFEDLTKRN